MRKSNFAKLSPEQQKFMSKMIMKEVGKIAEEKNISEEMAYELYAKGLFGGDRKLDEN